MPYASFSKAHAQELERLYAAAQASFKANKNVLKAGALKKALENAGKQLQAQLEHDIAGVRHNANEHFMKVDDWLGQCNRSLKRSKDAYVRWSQNAQETELETAGTAATEIAEIHTGAHTDANEFGVSWFEYRGWTPAAELKYISSSMKEVGKIMIESKSFLVKIAKMEVLQKEAQAVKNLAASKGNAHEADIVHKQEAAAQMLRTVEHMAQQTFFGFKDPNATAGNMETIRNNANNPRLAKVTPLRNLEQIFGACTNQIKGYVQSLSSMQKTYETESGQFDAEDRRDPTIKAALANCQRIVIETRSKVQNMENGYKNTVKDWERLRKNYKKQR